MAGSPIEVFTDIAKATGPAFLTSDTSFVNEAKKQTYILPRFMTGKEMTDMLQGGESIRDNIYFDLKSSYQHYNPNEAFTYSNPQLQTQWSVPWRFTKAEAVTTEHELGINGQMNRSARFQRYKAVINSKKLNLFTDLCNGMEEDFWAQPSFADMESSSGTKPQSLSCFVHEHNPTATSNGLATAGRPLDADGSTTYTTVQGIDPSTQTKWQNLISGYAVGAGTGTAQVEATTLNLFRAMTLLYREISFDPLPKGQEYSDPATMPNFITGSSQGLALYEDGLRVHQDTFVYTGRQDPAFPYPTFRGLPIVYIKQKDDAALYNGAGATLTTESDANTVNRGPRFEFWNSAYMCKVWHSDRYFHNLDPFTPSAQPMTRIMMVDSWHNNVCRSRRRLGIVTPDWDGASGAVYSGNDITGYF